MLEEIYRGGCVDSTFQWITVLFMALAQKDVSKFLTGNYYLKFPHYTFKFLFNIKQSIFKGPLSTYTVHFLQHLREFFSITFNLDNPKTDEDDDDNENENSNKKLPGATKVLLTCVGIGYTNMGKKTI